MLGRILILGPFGGSCVHAESGGIAMEFKKVLMVSSAAVALTAAGTAHAGDYFTVFGGATFQSDVDAHFSSSSTVFGLTTIKGAVYYHTGYYGSADVSAELDSGFVLGAAYGRNLNQFWRMELEMAYRENQVDSPAQAVGSYSTYAYLILPGSTIVPTYFNSGTRESMIPVDGSTSFFSVMANFWYDFNIAGNWETFVGVGLGMAQANVNDLEINYNGYAYADIADGSDWVFAYQFGVGAGYNLDNGVRLSAQYRYFGTDEAEIDGVHLEGEASDFLFGISFPLGN